MASQRFEELQFVAQLARAATQSTAPAAAPADRTTAAMCRGSRAVCSVPHSQRLWRCRRLDNLQDGLPGRLRQRCPHAHHARQVGVSRTGGITPGSGLPCAECAGFCAALLRNLRFPRALLGVFESCRAYLGCC